MTPAVLTLLDTAFNRAREAARVLEDQSRFLSPDPPSARAWRDLRRSIGALQARCAPLLPHRFVPRDPGARDTAPRGRNLAAIGTANAKRLQEALRSIEEHLKAFRPALTGAAARLRFDAYEAEQAAHAGSARRFAPVTLMALLTESLCRRPWLETARLLVRGGVDALQLREKSLGDREFLRRARALRRVAPVLVLNDRAGLVGLADADGVHVGAGDLSIADARALVGPSRFVGATVHGARDPVEGADYVSAGPVFRSPQKPDLAAAGLGAVRRARKAGIPFVAIGGITPDNLPQVLRAGATRVAVGTALTGAEDPERAARAMKRLLARARG